MNKEMISRNQGISMVILFMTDILVYGTAKDAKSDIWIVILVGLCIGLLLIAMYSKILQQYTNKTLIDIVLDVFGKYIGGLIGFIYIFYAFYLTALILVNLAYFLNAVGLQLTPMLITSTSVILLIIMGVKRGIEVIGRSSEYFVRFLYPVMMIAVFLMFFMVDANNLKPVLADGIQELPLPILRMISYPFGETILLTMVFTSGSVIRSKDLYKVMLIGLAFGGLLVFTTHVTAYLTLGEFSYTSSYFPIYAAVSRVNIRDVLQRFEITIAVAYLLGSFIKMSICALGACKGLESVLRLEDYRFMVTPIGILILIVSLTTHKNIMEMVNNFEGYMYYAVLVQLVIPILTFFIILLKNWRRKKLKSNKDNIRYASK